jgi:hypothetical protein
VVAKLVSAADEIESGFEAPGSLKALASSDSDCWGVISGLSQRERRTVLVGGILALCLAAFTARRVPTS